MLICGRGPGCGVSGSVRVRSCKGGTRGYSFGLSTELKGVGRELVCTELTALIGVGKAFAGYAERAEDILVSGLATDAVGIVDAVGRSSSVKTGRPCGGSIRSGCPR